MDTRSLNWAIVGLGDIVRKRVGPAILAQPQSKLRACVTRNPVARVDDLASLQPECVYTDYESMLADPEVEAVYIATPVFLHACHAIAALEEGKHVLVEKPMALNMQQCNEMLAAVRRSDCYLTVAYFRRYWPTFQRVKELLSVGELGQIVMVRAMLHSWYAPSPNDPKAWRVRPELAGGGVLFDVGSHRLDLLSWWFGLPRRIVASVGTRTHDYAADDSAAALMILDDGIPCAVSFNWNSKTWADELVIVGTEATITFTAVDGDDMTISRGRESKHESHPRAANAHYPMIDNFVSSVLAGQAPRFGASDGIAASQIMEWMTQSSTVDTWMETVL